MLGLVGVRLEEVGIARGGAVRQHDGDVVYIRSVAVRLYEDFPVHLEQTAGRVRVAFVVTDAVDTSQHLRTKTYHKI